MTPEERIDRIFSRCSDPRLQVIATKVTNGDRLDMADGVALYESPDLLRIGALANLVRERKNGRRAYYIVNRYLNPTNVCWVDCQLCAWAKKLGEDGGYTMSIEEAVTTARSGYSGHVSELHMVGGLHPRLPFSWYLDLQRALKSALPGVHLKAWTMVEIDWFARISKQSVADTVAALRDAGLDSCPGGGAEIFARRARDLIARNKIGGDRWLELSRACHEAGVRTNATMLYGHVETAAERVDHLIQLRDLQDQTGGFQCLVPLAFHPENTWLDDIPPAGGRTDLLNIAVSRLMLDNFDHIKAYWIQLTPKVTQTALSFGADDVGGTYVAEEITHAAGAETATGMSIADIESLIRGAGFLPVRSNTLYEPLAA